MKNFLIIISIFTAAYASMTVQVMDLDLNIPAQNVPCFTEHDNSEHITDSKGLLEITGTFTTNDVIKLLILDSKYQAKEYSIHYKKNSLQKIYLEPKEEEKAKQLHSMVIQKKRYHERFRKKVIDKNRMSQIPMVIDDPIGINRVYAYNVSTAPMVADHFIRGSYNQYYYLDHVPIYHIYHIFNLSSIISPHLVSYSEVYPSCSDADMSSSYGLVQKIYTDESKAETISGNMDISLYYSSLSLKIPINKSIDLTLSGRRSYMDLLVGDYINKVAPVNFDMLPLFLDAYGKLSIRPNNFHKITLSSFYAKDGYSYFGDYLDDYEISHPTIQDFEKAKIDINSYFYNLNYLFSPSKDFQNRLTAYYTYKKSGEKTVYNYEDPLVLLSNSVKKYIRWSEKTEDKIQYSIEDHIFMNPFKNIKFYTGASYQNWNFKDRDTTFITNIETNNIIKVAYYSNRKNTTAYELINAYSKAGLTLKRAEFTAGLRYDYILPSKEANILPRGGIIYHLIEDKLVSSFYYGNYAEVKNTNRITDSYQYLFNTTAIVNKNHSVSLDAYYNYFKNRNFKNNDYTDNTPGRRADNLDKWLTTGAEINYEYAFFNKKIIGNLSYAYNHVWNVKTNTYHRMHKPIVFKGSLAYQPVKSWRFSLLQEIFSGERYTPLTNIDAAGKWYWGKENSRKLPNHHYLAFSAEYKLPAKKRNMSLSLNLVNTYAATIYRDVDYWNVKTTEEINTKMRYEEIPFPSGFPFGNIVFKYEF